MGPKHFARAIRLRIFNLSHGANLAGGATDGRPALARGA